MKDYMICAMFWAVFTVMLALFGKTLLKKKKSASESFLFGYIAYSILTGIGGIVVQFFNLSWTVYEVYMLAIWILMIGVILYSLLKKKRDFKLFSIKEYLQEQWLLLVVCFILGAMLFLYYNAFWYGNHLDDGYYITKIATMPYNATRFRTNYSVGVEKSGIDSYVFNTWEIEASVYVKWLHVSATLYLRLFQSIFHYFLLANCVFVFTKNLFHNVNVKFQKTEYQFSVVIIILLGAYYLYLQDTNLFFLRDAWQYNSGMFLGSSIVRVTGILLLLVPFVGRRKIDANMIVSVIGIAFVLMTKSSTALPVIVITSMGYLFSWLFLVERNYKAGTIVAIMWMAMALFLPNQATFQQEVYKYVKLAIQSPVFIICTIIFLMSFCLKNQVINQLNGTIICMMMMMVVPQVNDIFEMCSMYAFVAGRTWTVFGYTYIILNFVYSYLLLRRCVKKIKLVKVGYAIVGMLFTVLIVDTFDSYGGELFLIDSGPVEADMKGNLKIIKENSDFVPESTKLLGNMLEEINKLMDDKLYLVCPELRGLDGTAHALATQIRIFAPDIISVSASGRYPVEKDNELYGYDQSLYEEFLNMPSEKTAKKFEEEVLEYGVNCIVTTNEACTEYLKQMGFQYYGSIQECVYYVWYKVAI